MQGLSVPDNLPVRNNNPFCLSKGGDHGQGPGSQVLSYSTLSMHHGIMEAVQKNKKQKRERERTDMENITNRRWMLNEILRNIHLLLSS